MPMICSFKQSMSSYLDVCDFMIAESFCIYPEHKTKMIVRNTPTAMKGIKRALNLVMSKFGDDKVGYYPLSKQYRFDVWCWSEAYFKKAFKDKDLTVESVQAMGKIIGLGDVKPDMFVCEAFINSSSTMDESEGSPIELLMNYDYVLGYELGRIKFDNLDDSGIDLTNLPQQEAA